MGDSHSTTALKIPGWYIVIFSNLRVAQNRLWTNAKATWPTTSRPCFHPGPAPAAKRSQSGLPSSFQKT
jgi:hypothetical protein